MEYILPLLKNLRKYVSDIFPEYFFIEVGIDKEKLIMMSLKGFLLDGGVMYARAIENGQVSSEYGLRLQKTGEVTRSKNILFFCKGNVFDVMFK